ncbi:guanylate kinase [Candidatus Uhrbacteria bacterium]|nr:guanylate kinase [Candidatus Uhrbacteria bacterium]
MQFAITAEEHKMRLDKFLKMRFPEFSRAHLQKLVGNGQVQVNGKTATAHHFLKTGDTVEATVEELPEILVTPNPEVRFEVLQEEKDFVAINKPAGLVVHQGEGHRGADTLANGLLARYPEIARVGDDLMRPGIVHRLDADVSGVMVVARTQDMFDHLKKQFKVHEVEKEYVAVVNGAVIPPQGVIEFAVARRGTKMVARPKGAQGKKAVTEYEVIEHKNIKTLKHENMTLLKIVTHTGRTHQIRVHLKAKGWPIVGDRLYGSKASKSSEAGKSSRLMLHARRLAFRDLKSERQEFTCPPNFNLGGLESWAGMRTAGRIFIVTGPSGVGKTTVAKALLERVPNLTRLVTYTTRAARPGEVDGQDYHFIGKKEFDKKVAAQEFFEYAHVYNEWYGSSKRDLDVLLESGKDVLMVIDIQGAKAIQAKLPQAISIFLQAESPQSLVRRLKRRGKMKIDDEARRTTQARQEMQEARYCTHTVTAPEGKIEETVAAVMRLVVY